MDEYIKREAVKRLVNTNYGGFLAAIDYIPAADVAPVVHGRWIPCKYATSENEDCSNCGYSTYYGNEYDYCPNCGAKMDG